MADCLRYRKKFRDSGIMLGCLNFRHYDSALFPDMFDELFFIVRINTDNLFLLKILDN
jgi:hypothetical protein